MSVHLLNQFFQQLQQHFNGGNTNGDSRILGLGAIGNISCNGNSSLSDSEEKRKVKKFEAIFIHYSGEEDNGMDSEEIEAFDYDEAYSKACKMPGRLYKVTEINL